MGSLEGNMTDTQKSEHIVSTKRQRIAKLSSQYRQRSFVSLSHHIDMDWMRVAWHRTRKDGAAGVDDQSAEQYEQDLEGNLKSLLKRLHTGSYQAPPVKRVYISKGDGTSRRPIGIPTLEDKILQRAVVMLLEPLYEQDFLNCSYGYRPGRNPHMALDELWSGLMGMGGGWVLELDIKSFFDALDKGILRSQLDKRVKDGVIRRTIDKWLKAGVMEDGALSFPDSGTPQGGVVSPLLANIYLHEVLDTWFEESVKPRLRGRGFMVRFADDATLVFQREEDARKVMEVLPKRFGRFKLTLHPQKTQLIGFESPARRPSTKAGTFNLLGFTHYWGKSRKGRPVIKRKTARDRFQRSCKSINLWCRKYRHIAVEEQWLKLSRKLRGHYNYYGITGNIEALRRYFHVVSTTWIKWLGRRSHKGWLNWQKANLLLAFYKLPTPRIAKRYRSLVKP